MPHDYKYAILEWSYVYEVDRTLEWNEYNISPNGQHQGSNIRTETRTETKIFRQKYWAPLSTKNRSHDGLDEWFKDIAYGTAVQQIQTQINNRNAANAARLQAWGQSWNGQQVTAGLLSNNAKPERVVYRPYDGKKFTREVKPSNVAGNPDEEIQGI